MRMMRPGPPGMLCVTRLSLRLRFSRNDASPNRRTNNQPFRLLLGLAQLIAPAFQRAGGSSR